MPDLPLPLRSPCVGDRAEPMTSHMRDNSEYAQKLTLVELKSSDPAQLGKHTVHDVNQLNKHRHS